MTKPPPLQPFRILCTSTATVSRGCSTREHQENHRLWLEPFGGKAKGDRPRGAGELKALLSSFCGQKTVWNFLFCPHYQSTACQVLPSPSQRRTVLGFLSFALQRSPCPVPGHSSVVSTCSEFLRPWVCLAAPKSSSTSHPPIPRQSPFWGLLLHCRRQGFVPIKEELTTIGRSGQSRIHSEIAARLWWGLLPQGALWVQGAQEHVLRPSRHQQTAQHTQPQLSLALSYLGCAANTYPG